MHVLELKRQLDGKTVRVCWSAATPAGAGESFDFFDAFDSPAPRCLSPIPFAGFFFLFFFQLMDDIFSLPFEAARGTFLCGCLNV